MRGSQRCIDRGVTENTKSLEKDGRHVEKDKRQEREVGERRDSGVVSTERS